MTLNTFVNGQPALIASQHNDNFASFQILEIDATTDLNTSVTGSSTSSDTESKDYSFTSTQLKKADYLIIDIVGLLKVESAGTSSGANSATCNLTIETTAPSAVTMLSRDILSITGNTSSGGRNYDNSFRFIHTLTAGEKSSGLTIRLTILSSIAYSGSGGSATSSFTNDQIVFSLNSLQI
jgi:hypothetical protein